MPAAAVIIVAVAVAGVGAVATAQRFPARRSSSLHYGICAALVTACALGIVALLLPLPPYLEYPLYIAATAIGVGYSYRLLQRRLRARSGFEQLTLLLFALMAAAAVFVTVGIVASVVAEALRFFQHVPLHDFLFGLQWSPQIAIREDQVGATGAFGFVPLLVGTLVISLIAMATAVPLGLLAAIYLSEYASVRLRRTLKPLLEILAGVPTIVYGFFAVVFLSPLIVDLGHSLGVSVVSENALAVGLVMGIMLIPFITSLSEDAFYAVPDSLRQAALGLGATKYEMALGVVFPAALPGVVSGILLGFSRAIGETMIVVMAAGISANLTVNPLDALTTVTVQIVTLLTGDQTFDDPKTLAAFALGLVLFVITLGFNLIAINIVRKYRQRYD